MHRRLRAALILFAVSTIVAVLNVAAAATFPWWGGPTNILQGGVQALAYLGMAIALVLSGSALCQRRQGS
jgi:hypothetical protein